MSSTSTPRHRASRRLTSLVAAAAATVLVVAAGCDDEQVEVPTAPPAEPGFDRIVAEVCGAVYRCCEQGEAGYVLGPYVSPEDCAERLLQRSEITSTSIGLGFLTGPVVELPNLAGLERAVTEGRIVVDEEALDACVTYLTTLQCKAGVPDDGEPPACTPPEPSLGSTPCDLLDLFVGEVQEGGTCTSFLASLECAPGLGCARDGTVGIEGECVPVGDIDDPCFGDEECGIHVREGDLLPGQHRRERLYCSQADGTCQLLRQAGETCLNASDGELAAATELIRCAPGLTCDPVTDLCVPPCARRAACLDDTHCDAEQSLVCVAGRCDLLRPEGAPCEELADCEEGLICTATAADGGGTACARRAEDGEPCVSHLDCDSGYCDAEAAECAPKVDAGDLCPSGDSAQCDEGLCTSEGLFCETDAECPESGTCDLTLSQCASYCIPLKPDGSTCVVSSECASQTCVVGFCRTPPLDDGVECDLDEQCDSLFCSPGDERVCTRLPLSLGEPCVLSEQCESEVCHQESGDLVARCIVGLEQGESCGAPGQAPCSPLTLYCDATLSAPVCVPLRATGEDCDSEVQCRGECGLRFSRTMCFPPDDPTAPLCDGAPAQGATP